VAELIRPFVRTVIELFYPSNCVGCGYPQSPGEQLCHGCRKGLTRITFPFCQSCSRPFEGVFSAEFRCPSCADRDLGFECAVATFRAGGLLRELIHRFKYSGQYHLRTLLAELLMEGFADERLRNPIDLIVPVPLHPTRQRERGYNQSEALSQIVSKKRGIPMSNALKRQIPTETQTQFDRKRRMQNLRNAFILRENSDVHGKSLLLLDDILTTGSTLAECAQVLRNAGAGSIRAVTVARG
jgi:ComF family protein